MGQEGVEGMEIEPAGAVKEAACRKMANSNHALIDGKALAVRGRLLQAIVATMW